MAWFNELVARVRGLLRRETVLDDIDEELRSHVEMATDENIARGMHPAAARRAALASFGSVGRARESAFDVRGGGWLDALWQDVRFGARLLAARPGFAVAAAATLALGIGATTAVFGVVNGVLLRPLPYREPASLERIVQQNSPTNRFGMSAADVLGLEELYQHGRVAAVLSREVTLTGGEAPEFVRAAYSSASLFDVLGVRPALGRSFLQGEDRPGGDRVALISHGLWQRRFGASPEVLGRQVALDGESFTVVGVLPADFASPMGGPAELWPVLQLETPKRRGPFYLRVVARRDDGVSVEQSNEALRIASREIFRRWSNTFSDEKATYVALPLEEVVIGDVGTTLLVLLGAVGFVLLIASVNVANLLLARAASRQQEIAMRAALGATRLRLVRQLVTEGALLAIVGGVGGVVLAAWGMEVLLALAPDNIPRLDQVRLDGWVLAFAAGCMAVSTIVLSLFPALHGVRRDVSDSLKIGGKGNLEGPGRQRLRGVLVAAEIALALPLLVGAGLMINSFVRLSKVDPGFDPERILTVRLSLPTLRYPRNEPAVPGFADELLRRVRSLPGVRSAAVTTNLPLDAALGSNNFNLERHPTTPGESEPVAEYMQVSSDYFRTMGIPLVEGRSFAESDEPDGPLVMVVSRAVAESHFPGENPIGMRLKTGGCTECPWTTIVGVVGDVKDHGLGADGIPAMYVPFQQEWDHEMHVVLRTDVEPESLAAAVRREVRDIDPELALSQVGTMEELAARSTGQSRYRMTVLGAFAAVALLLAAVGIYGVTAYAVSRRTREIGIRVALGAGRGEIVRLVLAQGMVPSLVGVGVGVVASFALTRFVSSMLFGVSDMDPTTFVAVVVVLTGVALAACYIPARRALAVDPLVALRYE
jgi:putative ABC transport system permease protein